MSDVPSWQKWTKGIIYVVFLYSTSYPVCIAQQYNPSMEALVGSTDTFRLVLFAFNNKHYTINFVFFKFLLVLSLCVLNIAQSPFCYDQGIG